MVLSRPVFWGSISIISSYKGFYTSGGAEGVGKATTGAVVLSSMTILIVIIFCRAGYSDDPSDEVYKAFGSNQVLTGASLVVKKARAGCDRRQRLREKRYPEAYCRHHEAGQGKVLIEDVDIATAVNTTCMRSEKKFGMLFQMAALFD